MIEPHHYLVMRRTVLKGYRASTGAGTSRPGPSAPDWGIMLLVRRASGLIAAVGLGLVLAACGGGLPCAGHYGSAGYRYIIAFAKPPTKRVVAVTTLTDTQYGPAIARRTIWSVETPTCGWTS